MQTIPHVSIATQDKRPSSMWPVWFDPEEAKSLNSLLYFAVMTFRPGNVVGVMYTVLLQVETKHLNG